MPGTFTYDEATNTIEVTDGTSGAPATFNDMYNADQSGTAELLPAEACTTGHTLTYQIRPVSKNALQISFTLSGTSATGTSAGDRDTLDITGTDWKGDAQTEEIDVSDGDGTYTGAKYWQTITNIDCTGWADGTLAVTQAEWGVVNELVADALYEINCIVKIGDGSTSTHFTSVNETVHYLAGKYPTVLSAATCQLGKLESDYGIEGSTWILNLSATTYLTPLATSTCVWLFYGSTLKILTNYTAIFDEGSLTIIDSKFEGNWDKVGSSSGFTIGSNLTIPVFRKVQFRNTYAPSLQAVPAIFDEVHTHHTQYAFSIRKLGIIIIEPLFTDFNVGEFATSSSVDTTVICRDPVAPLTNPNIQKDGANNWVREEYTCNIHTVDKDGGDLSSVTVTCTYTHLVEGSDGKTYKCILNHTAVDATHKPITGSSWDTYWELYDAGGGLGGDWSTGFDYKVDEQAFSVATDANGDITEQNIQYRQWAESADVLELRQHKFVFTHASYPDLTMDLQTVNYPVDWEVDMGQSDSDLTTLIQDAEMDNDGTAISLSGAMKLILAALTGKSSGGGTGTIVFRDTADSKNRISATVDTNGNRTAIGTRDGS